MGNLRYVYVLLGASVSIVGNQGKLGFMFTQVCYHHLTIRLFQSFYLLLIPWRIGICLVVEKQEFR